jgi:hypothetical protein
MSEMVRKHVDIATDQCRVVEELVCTIEKINGVNSEALIKMRACASRVSTYKADLSCISIDKIVDEITEEVVVVMVEEE